MTWDQILAGGLFALVALVVWRAVQYNRAEKEFDAIFYPRLRLMNRGKIDQPGWVKKPWQHEPCECKQQRLVMEAKIEAYAGSKVKPE